MAKVSFDELTIKPQVRTLSACGLLNPPGRLLAQVTVAKTGNIFVFLLLYFHLHSHVSDCDANILHFIYQYRIYLLFYIKQMLIMHFNQTFISICLVV